jgi:5-methylcytosine-specific restriction endonuclease McrA
MIGDVLAVALLLAVGTPVLLARAASPAVLVPRHWRMSYRRDRPRPSIRTQTRRRVMRADRRRCVYCGSRDQLQLDHIIPWSFGGLTCVWNLMVLCGTCNRVKSNYWKSPHGKVYYRAWKNSGNAGLAGQILACELRHRYSPLRWLRAFA